MNKLLLFFVFRCGSTSVIIDFVMKFNQSVDGKKVLTVLKDAAEQNKFGEYKVDPKSLKLIYPPSTDAPSTQGRICFVFVFMRVYIVT